MKKTKILWIAWVTICILLATFFIFQNNKESSSFTTQWFRYQTKTTKSVKKVSLPIWSQKSPASSICWNSVVDTWEECDDGNNLETDGCSSKCITTRCWDKIVQNPNGWNIIEECDDGNRVDTDSCTTGCKLTPKAVCGNLIKEEGEQCDDGNKIDSDGCTNDCKLSQPKSYCGDGILNRNGSDNISSTKDDEWCDDWNTIDSDSCDNGCRETSCWDGKAQQPNAQWTWEECDDGNTINNDGCSSSCSRELSKAVCGDWITQSPEQCDDGNTTSLDGCSANCVKEWVTGYMKKTLPQKPTTTTTQLRQ